MGKNLYNMEHIITKLGHRAPILLRNAGDGVPYDYAQDDTTLLRNAGDGVPYVYAQDDTAFPTITRRTTRRFEECWGLLR